MSSTKRKPETGITRFSKRIRGLAPEIAYSYTQTSYLPLEVKRIILEDFTKLDLKLVRLVSKDWCLAAVPLLFDRIYISPKKRDLDVFIDIIDHPVLCQAPRSLIWDATYFLPRKDQKHYMKRLLHEARFIHRRKFDDASTPYQHFINACFDMKDGAEARERVLSDYQHAAFVEAGFKVWQENAIFAQFFYKKGYFYSALCDGLRKLDRLRSVVVTSNLWNVDSQDAHAGVLFCNTRGSGPPLLRSWDFSHARPFSIPGTYRSAKDFHLISRALAETAVEIRDFSFYEDPYTGGLTLSEIRNPAEIGQLSEQGYFAYRNLTSFNIKFCVSTEDVFDYAVKLFPYLLSQMQHLKQLCIDIDELGPMEKSVRMRCHDNRIILPSTGVWSYLTDFRLTGATFGGWDFLVFLTIRMPRLRHLQIHDIDLTDWSWDGVFEGLNLGPKELRSISLPREARNLRHHSGKPYPRGPDWVWDDTEDEDEEIERFYEKMEYYVIHGGRHPNLPPEAPSSRSVRYLEPYSTIEEDDEIERKIARYKKAWKIPAHSNIGREEKLLALGA